MSRISYVNGAFVPHEKAMVHIEDRGYQFADGVYEYIAFFNRKALDLGPHLDRLERSLAKLQIAEPVSRAEMTGIIQKLIDQNGMEDGGIYLQATRGVSHRDHPFPNPPVAPALTMTISGPKTPSAELIASGAKVITHPDLRWAHCDIKSIALLPNVLAKQAATAVGAREAWLIKDGVITEGAVSNAFIIDGKGAIVTHPATNAILSGITRAVVLELARKNGIAVEERAYTLDEAHAASEAFLTSTTSNILPITLIDDKKVGGGKPGPISMKLLALYHDHIAEQTGKRFA